MRHAIAPNAEKIVVCSVHPGAVATEIQDQFKQAFGNTIGQIIKVLQTPMMRSPAEGSLGTLWAAVSPEVDERYEEIQGAYVPDPGKIGRETEQARDETLEDNVWNLCERLIKDKAGSDAPYPWNCGSKGA